MPKHDRTRALSTVVEVIRTVGFGLCAAGFAVLLIHAGRAGAPLMLAGLVLAALCNAVDLLLRRVESRQLSAEARGTFEASSHLS